MAEVGISKKNKVLGKHRKANEEINKLKKLPLQQISDADMYLNAGGVLRFRKYPWPQWFLGLAALAGAVFIIFMCYENVIKFKKRWFEYALLTFLLVLSFALVYSGTIETIELKEYYGPW